MENKKQDGAQSTAIVPTTKTTAELIPGQTAELIEKSFAENTVRNRRHALLKFDEWLQGNRSQTDCSLPISHTCSTWVKHQGQSLSLCPR